MSTEKRPTNATGSPVADNTNIMTAGGRLVLKDMMLLADGLLVMADSARAILEERPSEERMHRSPATLSVS